MDIRPRYLEGGWYPSTESDVRSMVEEWEGVLESNPDRNAGAGIAPHAGWYFSGRLAWDTIRRARPETQTVVVAGGHRPAGSRVLCAKERAFDTPSGSLPADEELAQALHTHVRTEPDSWVDNTVEVLLPLVKLRFPESRVLWIRVPNDEGAESLGATIARLAADLDRTIFFLASTDLTHYGPNYAFSPHGHGPAASEWVRDVNDKGILESFLAMDVQETLRRGNDMRAACSPGAVASAIGFARASGFTESRLCGYYTSREIHPSDSFVGYCSVTYS